ncbi:MAG: hypothetical protein K2X81_24485 [Candidatus Obscuribacterales bacterium]|nr:hypothetical protein [Candidatus Obscuribacterales bacterium]
MSYWKTISVYRRMLIIPLAAIGSELVNNFSDYLIHHIIVMFLITRIGWWELALPGGTFYVSPITHALSMQTYITLGRWLEPKQKGFVVFFLATFWMYQHLSYPQRAAERSDGSGLLTLGMFAVIAVLNIAFEILLRAKTFVGTSKRQSLHQTIKNYLDVTRRLLMLNCALLGEYTGGKLANLLHKILLRPILVSLLNWKVYDNSLLLVPFWDVLEVQGWMVLGLLAEPSDKWRAAKVLCVYCGIRSIDRAIRIWVSIPHWLNVVELIAIFLILAINWMYCKKHFAPVLKLES